MPGPTGTATTYVDTGLAPNTTRYYRVRAINAQGQGAPSTAVRGTTNAARPGQPQNLRARAAGPTSITLNWEAPASDGGERITGYTIRRRGPNDGTWITIPRNTGPHETTFTDTGLQPATAYRYQVAAINRIGPGQWSFEASTSTYAQAPGAPTGLTARAVGTSRIDLSWSAPRNTGGAPILGYRIEASDDGGRNWNIIIRRNTNSKTTTASDVTLQPATTRHYRVAAINTAGTGPFSNTARATTEATVPGTPRSLDANADGTSRIELSWREPTSDGGSRITGYRIEVSEDVGATWDNLVANSHNTRTTYVHTGLEPATRRHYRVSAINRIGVGRVSRVASAITDATVPDAPTGLTATAVTSTQIDLFWLAPAYDGGAPVTGYRIEVSENGTAWTDLVVNTGSRATTFAHTGLMPGSTRHYRVSAINRVGAGAPSDTASAATDDPVGRAGRLNTRVLPHVAAAMTSSTVSAIARRVDAVANGMGMERRVETNGLSSMAASLSAPDAGGLGLAQGDQAGLAALFGGTSFTMPLGASDAQQQSATGTQLASWGAGEYHYLGEPGQSTLDWKGNMVSAHAGIDARVGSDILAGVAGSYSSGSFDFTDKTGASPVKGTYGTTMASVHPYMAWFSGGGRTTVWGSAGLGTGDIEVDDEREGLRTSPASLLTGAGGASYKLLTRGTGGVRLKAEGWYGQVTVDGSAQIEEVTLEMQRGKLALELTQGFRTGTGNEMAVPARGRDALRQRRRRERRQRGSRRWAPLYELESRADRGGPRPVRDLGPRRLRGMGHGRHAHVRPGDPRPGALDPGGAVVRRPHERGEPVVGARGARRGGRPRHGHGPQRGRRSGVWHRRLPRHALQRLLPRPGWHAGLQQRRALRARVRRRAAPRRHAAREHARCPATHRRRPREVAVPLERELAVAIAERPRPVRRAGARFR